MQPMIVERNGRRYGRMVASEEWGERIATSPPLAAPRNDGSAECAEERKVRFCAEEDVEILTAVNQLRKEQRRRDAAAAQRRKKAVRKQRIVKAVCGLLDIIAYASCLFAFVLLLVTQNRLIAVGMLALAAVYAVFTQKYVD